MTLRIHALFHTDYEDLSFIKQWANSQHHMMSVSRSYDDCSLPEPDRFDWLIVMGGPMSVHDEEKYPWLIAEKHLIRQAIDAGKTVIGICLGAQLLAHCLGATVQPSGVKEIGWLPIRLTPRGQSHPLLQDLPKQDFTVFHFHGDGFDCPKGASIIASTESWANQGFIYQTQQHKALGTWVMGWQCHFEVTKESLAKMIVNGNDAIQSGLKDYPKTVQSAAEIIRLGYKYIEDNNARLAAILNRMANSG
ncbi:type 1 glutamine amidotransferase [Psychrobacter sp. DAB_AL62B]|uniref:type 1 glutamine amidotransferase n=1 Tax=Psychrobacter sp. DAB_AL62B TaxID=1028420 RepID=UPI00238167A6|nr:type 1 glutamine amidotransferase [Psychrobacter sp. DAB_AL62B]MDE4454432.1 type 1 glutamine amidotransferase [Psychrobacter sp. DAB_AL62B]